MAEEVVMRGYKAFDKGLICKGKQYAENTVFEEDKAEICFCGMHFCSEPLEVLKYYPLVNKNGDITEFAEVEALDKCETNDNKKYCTKKLKIGARLSFVDLVQASVSSKSNKKETNAQIGSSGDCAQIGSSGNSAQIGSSGNYAQIGSSGNCAQIGSSGDSAQIGSSGNYAQIGSSGNCAQIGSSGDSAQIGSSGDCAQISSSGDYAQIGSSGDSARIGSSGDGAQIGSSGNYARIGSEGRYAVICCAGDNCFARAKKGSWITLSEWKWSDKENANIPICVKTVQVDGEIIKEDILYKLENGEFVEVCENDERT